MYSGIMAVSKSFFFRSVLFSQMIFFLFLWACDKDNAVACGKSGTIKNYLGQDGCTLVIIDDEDGDVYQPTNIQEFGLIFNENDRVNYSFQLNQTQGNCLLGVDVTLICIQKM